MLARGGDVYQPLVRGGTCRGVRADAARRARAKERTELGGTWIIDRDASEFPREVGFGASFVPVQDDGRGRAGEGGRRGGGNSTVTGLAASGRTTTKVAVASFLTEEVRTPPSRSPSWTLSIWSPSPTTKGKVAHVSPPTGVQNNSARRRPHSGDGPPRSRKA